MVGSTLILSSDENSENNFSFFLKPFLPVLIEEKILMLARISL